MSWVNKEKSKTGDVQYINASYTTSINTSDTSTNIIPFNVIGYTKGSIAYNVEGIGDHTTNVIINLQGSNDGTNYFDFNTSSSSSTHTTTGIGNVSWNIPSKLIRINASITKSSGLEAGDTTIGGLDIVGTAGGGDGGGGNHDTSSISITLVPGGTDTQVQYNDNNSFFGGAPGVLYDNGGAGQIQLTAGTASLPAIAFSDGTYPAGNYDTGIYRPSSDEVGITTAGSIRVKMNPTSHISIESGTVTDPTINFAVTGSDSNTGMYNISNGVIGLTTGGVQKVGIYSADEGDFIEGINIGTTSNIAGIRRLSGTAANSWEDGNLGNSSALVFVATDFLCAQNRITSDIFYAQAGVPRGSLLNCMQSASATFVAAQKLIPKGFQVAAAANFTVFSETTFSIDYIVQSGKVDSGQTSSATARFGATANTNTPLPLNTGGPDVGDGFNTITIVLDSGAIWTDTTGIIGATIDIERV